MESADEGGGLLCGTCGAVTRPEVRPSGYTVAHCRRCGTESPIPRIPLCGCGRRIAVLPDGSIGCERCGPRDPANRTTAHPTVTTCIEPGCEATEIHGQDRCRRHYLQLWRRQRREQP